LDKTIKSKTQVIVAVDILHANTAELVVSLIAPDGTTVILHNLAAGTNLATTYPTFRAPAQSLSAFQDKKTKGQWRLRVFDNNNAVNAGQLRSWSLRFLKD
jgi:subtilisin-like proprotein convertase family protein